MTWSTSEVAVCCSSDSVRSVGALAQFVEQPRVLDGDDAWAAKFVTSSICLSVKGRTSWR